MAYEEDLANRVREQLADEDARSERAVFGGLAFMLSGNMAVGGGVVFARSLPPKG